jgi:hypothetical protein
MNLAISYLAGIIRDNQLIQERVLTMKELFEGFLGLGWSWENPLIPLSSWPNSRILAIPGLHLAFDKIFRIEGFGRMECNEMIALGREAAAAIFAQGAQIPRNRRWEYIHDLDSTCRGFKMWAAEF